jgi:hypothetical protein
MKKIILGDNAQVLPTLAEKAPAAPVLGDGSSVGGAGA